MSDASSPEQSPKVAPTEQTALMSPSRPKPVLYLRRWVTLMLFSLISFTNAMNWITFSPFASHARTFYGVESIAIDSLSTVYMMVYIPFVFLSSWLIDRAGLRVGVRLIIIPLNGSVIMPYLFSIPPRAKKKTHQLAVSSRAL